MSRCILVGNSFMIRSPSLRRLRAWKVIAQRSIVREIE